jgi:hypothetical protein
MGVNVLEPNTNATAAQVASLATSVAALPSTASLATQSNVAIKSIQRGGVSANAGSANVTISAVNTAKTELRWCGVLAVYVSTGGQSGAVVSLANSTTISVSAGSGGAGPTPTAITWELTEFY